MAKNGEKAISAPDLRYLPHPGGLGCTLYEKMWENHEKLAQISTDTDKFEDYESLLKKCVRTALAMRSKKVTAEDVVLICSANNLDICVPYVGALFLGAKPCAIDPNLPQEKIEVLLKLFSPKMIFVSSEIQRTIQKISQKLLNSTIEIVTLGSKTFLQPQKDEGDFKPIPVKNIKDTAVIMIDNQKLRAVCLSHYSLLISSYNLGYYFPVRRILVPTSFDCVLSINSLIFATMFGSARIVCSQIKGENFREKLLKYQPNLSLLSKEDIKELCDGKVKKINSSLPLQTFIVNGKLTEKQIMKMEEVLPEAILLVAFDCVEAAGVVSCFKPHILEEMGWYEEKPLSSGTLLPGYSVKILDRTTGEELGPDTKGKLCIKSSFGINRYFEADLNKGFDPTGWAKIEANGWYDQDSCLYIED